MVESVRYAEYPPAPDVRSLADRYWRLTVPRTAVLERALPDGHCEFVVHLADACVRVDAAGHETLQPSCLLIGQMTSPVDLRPAGALDAFGIRLRPEASVRDTASRILALDAVFGGAARRWEQQLRECRHDAQRVTASDAFLRTLQALGWAADARARAAVEALRAGGSVAFVAGRLGWSPRQLERHFHERVGLPPKVYARLARFQSALALRRARPLAAWADVALACGYYDQAHLIRDFRQFAGHAPAARERAAGPLESSLAARDEFFQDAHPPLR